MTNDSNLTSKYEVERMRAAEQSQMVYLQGQIDELRRVIKDQTNKYQWAVEQVRKVENTVAQFDGVFDRHRQEVAQALDGFRRDIITLRKEVASALIKIDESQKPLREMQTQIHQLGEARKLDRDQVAGWLGRIEDLESRTRDWNSQVGNVDERYRALAGRLEGLYGADEAIRAESRKINEDLQIEKQSLRRQAIEAQQKVGELHAVLEDHLSRIVRLDEIRQYVQGFSEQLPGQIAAIEQRLGEVAGEIKRIERIATEHFLLNQERLEDLRQQQDEKVVSLHEIDDQNQRQLSAWLERMDGMVRELEGRVARHGTRLEQAYREQRAQLALLEERDVQLIEAMAAALRGRAEKIKAEQVEHGTGDQR